MAKKRQADKAVVLSFKGERRSETSLDAETPVLSLFGVIGWDVTAARIRRALSEIDPEDDLRIELHSPGGFYDEGAAIFHLFDRRPGRNEMEVIGSAGSAASFIAMAGDRRLISEMATFYIHRPWSIVIGHEDEMVEEAEILRKLTRVMEVVYMRHWDGSREELVEALAGNGSTLTADEAVESGLLDAVIPGRDKREESESRNNAPTDSIESIFGRAAMPFTPKNRMNRSELLNILDGIGGDDTAPDDVLNLWNVVERMEKALS